MLKNDTRIRLCRAREMLRVMDDDALHVDDLARELRMSPFHLIRQFQSVFSVTPHQYRIASRVERARILLARGDHSVTEVCMEVGFSSLGSFSTLFAAKVGESPSAYQRRMRVTVAVPRSLRAVLFPGCFSLMAHLPRGAFSNFREA